MLTTYRFEFCYGKVDITVDSEKFTPEVQKEICEFWCPSIKPDTLLQRLAIQLLIADFTEFGILERARMGLVNSLEGWPPLDGSYGIYLERLEEMELSYEDIVTKIIVQEIVND
jgi:hypothetical protein